MIGIDIEKIESAVAAAAAAAATAATTTTTTKNKHCVLINIVKD